MPWAGSCSFFVEVTGSTEYAEHIAITMIIYSSSCPHHTKCCLVRSKNDVVWAFIISDNTIQIHVLVSRYSRHMMTKKGVMIAMKKIYVVNKTHLDIGFTDLAENVLHKYCHDYIQNAITLAEDLRKEGKDFV